jgi:hypothetical protein
MWFLVETNRRMATKVQIEMAVIVTQGCEAMWLSNQAGKEVLVPFSAVPIVANKCEGCAVQMIEH